MKCISCEVEINPKWVHAIDINVCPFCGQCIMEEGLKSLFSSLRVLMDSLTNYPEELNDWMLSNHNYIKIDSPRLMEFVPKHHVEQMIKENSSSKRINDTQSIIKINNGDNEEEVLVEKIQSDDKTNSFFKRAEAIRPNVEGFRNATEKTQYLKAMAQKIKKEVALDAKPNLVDQLSQEMIDDADPEAIIDYNTLIDGGEIMSSLPNTSDDDEIPAAVLAMANRAASKKDASVDLAKLRLSQAKLAESRKNFQTGAKGSFFRS